MWYLRSDKFAIALGVWAKWSLLLHFINIAYCTWYCVDSQLHLCISVLQFPYTITAIQLAILMIFITGTGVTYCTKRVNSLDYFYSSFFIFSIDTVANICCILGNKLHAFCCYRLYQLGFLGLWASCSGLVLAPSFCPHGMTPTCCPWKHMGVQIITSI